MLVGGGVHQAKYKALAESLGIIEKVDFPGLVPYEDVPYWQNQLDIYVSPSNSESFGVSALEAMACEKPVIVTDVGGLPEVVVADETGYIVPPRKPEAIAEKIVLLLNDSALRQKMGRAGRLHVQRNYEWQQNVAQMIAVYQAQMNKKG